MTQGTGCVAARCSSARRRRRRDVAPAGAIEGRAEQLLGPLPERDQIPDPRLGGLYLVVDCLQYIGHCGVLSFRSRLYAAGGSRKPPPASNGNGTRKSEPNTEPGQRALDALELIRREGPMTIADIKRRTGWTSSIARAAVDRLLKSKEPVIRETGRKRSAGTGPPSREVEAIANPEPAAAASSSAPPAEVPEAAAPASDAVEADRAAEERLDEALTPEPSPEVDVEVDLEDYADDRPRRSWSPDEATTRLVERMVQHCTLEPKSITELIEELEVPRATIMRIIQSAGRFEQYGERRYAGKLRPVYRPVPLPHERPDVTIRQADRSGTVEGRVLAQLQASRLTIEQLAARLVLHPRLVAEAISGLAREGELEKLPGGVWALTEQAAV